MRRTTESQPGGAGRRRSPSSTYRLAHYHLTVNDVVTAAREQHGLRSLGEVQWAVLEVSGGISVVPRDRPTAASDDVRIDGAASGTNSTP